MDDEALIQASILAALQQMRENSARSGVMVAPGSVVVVPSRTYPEDTPGPVPVTGFYHLNIGGLLADDGDQREAAKWRAAFEAAAAERDELRAKLARRDASLLRATGRLP